MTSASDQEGWLGARAAADLAALYGRREVTGDHELGYAAGLSKLSTCICGVTQY